MTSTRESCADIFNELKNSLVQYLKICLSEVASISKNGLIKAEDAERVGKDYIKIHLFSAALGESKDIADFKKVISNYFEMNHDADDMTFPKWIAPVVADCLLMIDSSGLEQSKSLHNFIVNVDIPQLKCQPESNKKKAIFDFMNCLTKATAAEIEEVKAKEQMAKTCKLKTEAEIESKPVTIVPENGKLSKGGSKLFSSSSEIRRDKTEERPVKRLRN